MGGVQTFGRFLLHRQLDTTGAHGDLWLAYDSTSQTALVLKLLRDEHRQNGNTIARFEHEIELSLKLKHPHLVEALEGGHIDGRPYLALDWIPGQSAESLVATAGKYTASIPSQVAAAIVRQVLSGLAYAHAMPHLEFVHRDISPANVMISYDGQARLIDYGLADSTEKEPQTQAGLVTGTIGYISPEQWARQAPASPRTDVYSMGAVLWHLLSYALPPDITKPNALGEVQLRLQELSVPAELSTIVLRALDPDPRARYQSAAEMAGALEWTHPAEPAEIAKFIRSLFQGAVRMAENELATMHQAYDAPLDGVKTQMVAATKNPRHPLPGRERAKPTRLSSILFIAGVSVFLVGTLFTLLSQIVPALFPKIAQRPTAVAPGAVLPTTSEDAATANLDSTAGIAPQPLPLPAPATVVPSVKTTENKAPASKPIHHDSGSGLVLRAEAAYRDGKFREAIRLTTDLIAKNSSAHLRILRANAYLALGDGSRAARDFQAVLRQEPRNREAKEGLASAKNLR